MAQGKVKMLRPPHVWENGKTGVQEDKRYARFSRKQVREMKNGVYDWAEHQFRPLKGI